MSKIKTGVVSYGFSGQIFQCPFIEAHDEFELTGVVERHGEKSKEDYPNIILYRDYKEMLDNDEIELIIVSTPSHLHFEHARMALEKDKHVLIEKPFASTYEEAKIIKELAEAKGKIATAYQNRRYDGDFLTIQQIISDPSIKIYEFEAVWDRFKPTFRNDWHEEGHKGADLLFDIGPHFLDQALRLFGEPETWHGTAKKIRPNSQIIDYFFIELNYKDMIVHLKSTLIAAKFDVRYKIHTNKGTYYFYKMGEQEHQLKSGMLPNDKDYGDNANYDLYDEEGEKTSFKVIKGSYMDYFSKLAKAIREEGEAPVSAEDAVRVIRYLSEIRDSM